MFYLIEFVVSIFNFNETFFSSNFKHSTGPPSLLNQVNNKAVVSRLQKENNPAKGDHRIPSMLKAVTVSVVNNLSKENAEPTSQISCEVDVSSNKKIVKLSKSPDKERIVSIIDEKSDTKKKEADPSKELVSCDKKDTNHPAENQSLIGIDSKDTNDYQSPLQAFGSTT